MSGSPSKEIIKKVVPSFVKDVYRKAFSKPAVSWSGDYPTWQAALGDSTGYDADNILQKVKDSILKVKNGEAVYERDSYLFDKIEYSWPLLSGLMWIAAQHDGNLRLVDFGGSLGSTYFQNRVFLKDLREVQWGIVEQAHFVTCGNQYIADEKLKFFQDIPAAVSSIRPSTVLLSGVLQCIENPYEMLDGILNHDFKYLIIDRLAINREGKDRITVQKISPVIYEASYPAWFFSEEKLLSYISSKYEVMADFICPDQANIPSIFKGYIMRRKS